MRLVVALGGNALLRRGQDMTFENQKENAEKAANVLVQVGNKHELLVAHGNGPQVGLSALRNLAYADKTMPYPLDALGAETQGLIGYMLEMAMRSKGPKKPIATILSDVIVSKDDPAFKDATKFIGPVYTKEESEKVAAQFHWEVKPDGKWFRRVVFSPRPTGIAQLPSILALLAAGQIVIAGGGGGVPVIQEGQKLTGIEGVIDKDRTSSFLAQAIKADKLVIATDVPRVALDWGTDHEKSIKSISAADLKKYDFAAGSMGPKVEAAINFVENTGHEAVIGSLDNLNDILEGKSGTIITKDGQSVIE